LAAIFNTQYSSYKYKVNHFITCRGLKIFYK